MALNSVAIGFGIEPMPGVKATTSNFRTTYNFATQFAPDKVDELFAPFNHASMVGILSAMGATEEYQKQADTHMWVESGQLIPVVKGGVSTFTTVKTGTASGSGGTLAQTIVSASGTKLPFQQGDRLQVVQADNGAIDIVIVTSTAPAATMNVTSYNKTTFNVADAKDVIVTKIGNDQLKGSDPISGAIGLDWTSRQNNFKITRGHHEEFLSDIPNKTWFSAGGNYFWTNQEFDAAQKRFMIQREIDALTSDFVLAGTGAAAVGLQGMQGVFPAIRSRGNNWADDIATIDDFETIIKRMEIAGCPSAMMMLTNTPFSLKLDRLFAGLNNVNLVYNGSAVVSGANYGSFVNEPEMLLQLGFKGIQWGSYKFFKQVLSAFTNPTSPLHYTVNAEQTTQAIMLPIGETPVSTDMELGRKNVPYITMMYKGGNGEDRSLKTTMIDFQTNGKDKVQVEYLSEFLVRTACANKMFLFEKAL